MKIERFCTKLRDSNLIILVVYSIGKCYNPFLYTIPVVLPFISHPQTLQTPPKSKDDENENYRFWYMATHLSSKVIFYSHFSGLERSNVKFIYQYEQNRITDNLEPMDK